MFATDTKTGKTAARAIAAVMVHHDTNRYDLTIRADGRTAVIGTTSNHPFWDATTGRWVKAGALKYGTHLRTPSGGTATVLGGHAPADRSGWMWDLTIPGNHDFYIAAGISAVLVHNCGSEDKAVSPAAQGAAGVNQTVADIEAAGGRIIGREVGIKAGGWRARADLYVQLPSGQKAFIEVKTGPSAELSLPQRGAYPEIISNGGVPYGKNAANAGLPPGVPIGPTPVWVVLQPWPLGELP